MFRDILVPLDGSRLAETALPLAAQLARSAKARLHLFLAHEPIAPLLGMGDIPLPAPALGDELIARQKAYLAEAATRLGKPDESVQFHSVEGRAGPEICEEADRLNADLVVMTSHGRGALGRLWFGSVTDYVLRHLSVPVLVLPPGTAGQPAGAPPLGELLVALDLSTQSEAILDPVTELAVLAQARITLLHVIELIVDITQATTVVPLRDDSALVEASKAEAERRLEGLAERLRRKGVGVSTRVRTAINAAGGLLETLEQDGFDLMALTTHGRGGVRRFLVGSVADKVIRGSAKPVLVLRPPQQA